MKASVICISHADGAEGQAVGELVATKLGYRYVDDAIITDAARGRGLFPESVSYAEGAKAKRSIEVDFGRVEKTEDLRDLIRATIHETADGGNIVIVAHAASYALTGRDDVLRVLVTAPVATRAGRVAVADALDPKNASRRLAESDKGRAVYLQRFYGIKTERPTDYDLVINTERLAAQDAAALIASAASPTAP
ncbi:MAG TPA: cytidylate kinase-like family protein [Gaiellaceae bacterium]|nr:cytidylate kinase-like family protein [Gaiellaceae bacterium]